MQFIKNDNKEISLSEAAFEIKNEIFNFNEVKSVKKESDYSEIIRVKKHLIGIENKNLTCYINSIIQLIFSCKK